MKDPFTNLWIILEKTAKTRTCHCMYMAGIGETCNHVATAMYCIEDAVQIGLTNLACTISCCQIEKILIKDLDFSRKRFWPEREKRRLSVASPKKRRYDLLK